MATRDESDLIGTLGEGKFDDLAVRARLLPSTPTPDKTGKDRIVEFRLDSRSESMSYDKRPPPRQCLIQVKTVGAKYVRATLALDKAERLAKDLRPTAVCIIRINDDETFLDMHLVHLAGPVLAKALKRLRQHQAKGRVALHKATLSFHISDGQPVDLVPSALWAALAAMTSMPMEMYVVKKAEELRTLGFSPNPLTFDFTVSGNLLDIQDAVLGLRELRPSEYPRAIETRFDIDLPVSLFEDATGVKVQISAPSGATIRATNASGLSASTFCDVRALPVAMPARDRKIVIENDFLRFQSTGLDATLNCPKGGMQLGQLRLSTQNWLDLFHLMEVLRPDGKVVLEIIPTREPVAKVTLETTAAGDPVSIEFVQSCLRLLEKLSTLQRLVGEGKNTFALEELYDEQANIQKLHSIVAGGKVANVRIGVAPFPGEHARLASLEQQLSVVCVGAHLFGDPCAVTFQATLSFEPGMEPAFAGKCEGHGSLERLAQLDNDVLNGIAQKAAALIGTSLTFVLPSLDY